MDFTGTASITFAHKFKETKVYRRQVHLNKADGTPLVRKHPVTGEGLRTVVLIELTRATAKPVDKGKIRAKTRSAAHVVSPYESPRSAAKWNSPRSGMETGPSRRTRAHEGQTGDGTREEGGIGGAGLRWKPHPSGHESYLPELAACNIQASTEVAGSGIRSEDQSVSVLTYSAGEYFGEFEAIPLSFLPDLTADPLAAYMSKDGIATATIRAAERCELLRIEESADIRLFNECMRRSTLKLLDRLCTVGQYTNVDEDSLAKLATFGRERWLKRGEVIFVDGASPEHVVLVMQGQLKVRHCLAHQA